MILNSVKALKNLLHELNQALKLTCTLASPHSSRKFTCCGSLKGTVSYFAPVLVIYGQYGLWETQEGCTVGGKLVHTRVVSLSDKPPWSSQKIEWKWAGNYVRLSKKQRLRERTVRQAEPPGLRQVPFQSICMPPFWNQRRLGKV